MTYWVQLQIVSGRAQSLLYSVSVAYLEGCEEKKKNYQQLPQTITTKKSQTKVSQLYGADKFNAEAPEPHKVCCKSQSYGVIHLRTLQLLTARLKLLSNYICPDKWFLLGLNCI